MISLRLPTRLFSLLLAVLAIYRPFGTADARAGQGNLGRPVISKVDPPNWWIDMPNPMLLVHGENLRGAGFTISPASVELLRSQTSGNGHWAFLWLNTQRAAPGTLRISAATPSGSAEFDFILRQRKPSSAGFQGFSSRDVMYLIMTDRFADGETANDNPANGSAAMARAEPRGWHGGDFAGIAQHLDYLQQLGITTIWTTPIYDNGATPEAYHGYSAVDMYGVDPHFGTLADYQHLVTAAHARGIKMVLDTVPNHVGPMNPWAKDPPTSDWFHGTAAHHFAAEGDFRAIPNPHSTPQARHAVTHGWFADMLPDLNQENPLVAQYLIQNAVWWVETAGLDGLRLDTFPFVSRAFWQQFHAELHALYPRLTTVGEIFNPNPVITSYFAGGATHRGVDTGLYTPFDFPTMFALRDVLVHRAPATRLNDVLGDDWLYPHPDRLVVFEGNHDTPRFLSEPGATPRDLKLAFGVLATTRGMVQIYSGDEIAMQGGKDPDNRRDFPGGFAGATHNAFSRAGRTPDEQSMFAWTSTLFRFRHQHPVLQTGQLQTVFSDATALAYLRTPDAGHGCLRNAPDSRGDVERFLVLLNTGEKDRTLAIDTRETALGGCNTFTRAIGVDARVRESGDTLTATIPSQQVIIYQVR